MKTAVYVEDGVVQLVITPENDFERNALNGFSEKPMEARLFAGSFYDCRGGWVRQKSYSVSPYGGQELGDKSLILVARDKEIGA